MTRTVLVTGGARRIGRVIALDLARHGWRVAVHHHLSAEDAEAVAAEIEGAGGTAARPVQQPQVDQDQQGGTDHDQIDPQIEGHGRGQFELAHHRPMRMAEG